MNDEFNRDDVKSISESSVENEEVQPIEETTNVDLPAEVDSVSDYESQVQQELSQQNVPSELVQVPLVQSEVPITEGKDKKYNVLIIISAIMLLISYFGNSISVLFPDYNVIITMVSFYVCGPIGFIIDIYVVIKDKKNVLAKILLVIYLFRLVLVIISVIFLILLCNSCKGMPG